MLSACARSGASLMSSPGGELDQTHRRARPLQDRRYVVGRGDSRLTYCITSAIETFEVHCGVERADSRGESDLAPCL